MSGSTGVSAFLCSEYQTTSTWFMDRVRLAMECAFTVWFLMSNSWLVDGRPASERSNHCRLLLRLFTFSCMICSMPLLLCAVLCCSVPCFIRVLGFEEEDIDEKGASDEIIAALPVHKFNKIGDREKPFITKKDQCSSPVATPGSETGVPTADPVCCICLGKYNDGADVRQLPCSHDFHMDCVDRWLRISASCPLCKHEITLPKLSGSETEMEKLLLCC